MRDWLADVGDAALDLLLGCRCAGCDRPGRMLCPHCRTALPRAAAPAWPTPVPAGLVAPWAAGAYEGTLRDLVVGHKDRGHLAFRRPLGDLLALAVGAAVGPLDPAVPVLLVPVPSRPGSARRRGHDPTGGIVRTAARRLDAAGRRVLVAPLLRSSAGVADQAGLDAPARAANVAGSMSARAGVLRRLSRRVGAVHVVVCDDVLTTGATAREAQRALASVGLAPVAIAVVAATQRRRTAGADRSPAPHTRRGTPGLS